MASAPGSCPHVDDRDAATVGGDFHGHQFHRAADDFAGCHGDAAGAGSAKPEAYWRNADSAPGGESGGQPEDVRCEDRANTSGALTLGATGSQSITLQPASIGTALLSLGALPGSPSPASGGQLVVNVTAQALTLADFKLGATEQVPVRFLLADDQPTPSSPLFIYPVVSDGKLLQLSTDVKSFGSNQIQLMIPAGTRFSNPLWVQALSDTGKPQIRVDFQGATYSTTVTLDKPAFVFAEANGSNTMLPELLGTSPVNLKVVPAVSPDGSPLLTPAITPGAAMRTLTVSSSNPSVAQVVTSTVTFAPGDTQKAVQVRLLATGTATISLGGDASAYLGTLLSKVTLVVK